MMNENQNCESSIARSKTPDHVPTGQDLRDRTKQLALRIIKLFGSLQKGDVVAQVLGKQVLRSGTSVGAHYREACRARSVAEFISKMEAGMQELDETSYWLDLLGESKTLSTTRLAALKQECAELLAIFVVSVKTAKRSPYLRRPPRK